MGLVDYDSDSDSSAQEETPAAPQPPKKSLFAALPPPKHREATRKRTILEVQPVAATIAAEASNNVAGETERSSIKRKFTSESQGLSALLPAPKKSSFKPVSKSELPNEKAADKSNGESIMAVPDDQVELSGDKLSFKPKSIKPANRGQFSSAKPEKQSLFSIPDVSRSSIQKNHVQESVTYQPMLASESRPAPEHVIAATDHDRFDRKDEDEEETEEAEELSFVHPSDQFIYDPNKDYSLTAEDPSTANSLRPHETSQDSSRRRDRRGDQIGPQAIMQEYDVNQQYLINQSLLESGETGAESAPVRFVGTGKHQLGTLLNLAHSQRDSLEESFATQRRAMRDAKAKYGR